MSQNPFDPPLAGSATNKLKKSIPRLVFDAIGFVLTLIAVTLALILAGWVLWNMYQPR
jgi:hypothetical protein